VNQPDAEGVVDEALKVSESVSELTAYSEFC
jgi:hypothetical protein